MQPDEVPYIRSGGLVSLDSRACLLISLRALMYELPCDSMYSNRPIQSPLEAKSTQSF